VGFKTPRNTREVRGLSNLLKIRGVPLCLIFGTKNSKHQGTPGVFGSAVLGLSKEYQELAKEEHGFISQWALDGGKLPAETILASEHYIGFQRQCSTNYQLSHLLGANHPETTLQKSWPHDLQYWLCPSLVIC
jgi:hypothetical protein